MRGSACVLQAGALRQADTKCFEWRHKMAANVRSGTHTHPSATRHAACNDVMPESTGTPVHQMVNARCICIDLQGTLPPLLIRAEASGKWSTLVECTLCGGCTTLQKQRWLSFGSHVAMGLSKLPCITFPLSGPDSMSVRLLCISSTAPCSAAGTVHCAVPSSSGTRRSAHKRTALAELSVVVAHRHVHNKACCVTALAEMN